MSDSARTILNVDYTYNTSNYVNTTSERLPMCVKHVREGNHRLSKRLTGQLHATL